jgi:hypothetical protein
MLALAEPVSEPQPYRKDRANVGAIHVYELAIGVAANERSYG